MLLLGHRGSPHQFPENTLASFQAALDAGLDGVEWDVRRLSDGTLVIHHDAGLPARQPLAQLYPPDLPAAVPTLAEALAWAADTGAVVNIELKFEGVTVDSRVDHTLRLIRAFGLSRSVVLSSFHPLQLLAARQLAPDVARALLIHRAYPAPLLAAVMRQTGCLTLHPTHQIVDETLMAQARQRGWKVNAWTVNTPAEVHHLAGLGVAGLIGDWPAVLLEARA